MPKTHSTRVEVRAEMDSSLTIADLESLCARAREAGCTSHDLVQMYSEPGGPFDPAICGLFVVTEWGGASA